jgi:heme oxygenase
MQKCYKDNPTITILSNLSMNQQTEITKNDIEDLHKLQATMQKDIERKLGDKVELKTTILNSLVTLIQDMKTENDLSKKRNKAKKKDKERNRMTSPKVSQTDLTYSLQIVALFLLFNFKGLGVHLR